VVRIHANEPQAESGFIMYPGGRVDARSYAPAAHSIAAHGFLVVIVPMPLNLAIFAPKVPWTLCRPLTT